MTKKRNDSSELGPMALTRRAAGIVRQIADGWQQTLSGLGTARDKGRASSVAYCPPQTLDERTLQNAYRGNWLVRRIINDLPEEATRRGFGGGVETPRFDELNFAKYAEGALQRACNLARLMGGAGVYIGYADGGADLEAPARAGAEVSFLDVFHRFEVQGVEGSRDADPASPTYGQPQLWRVVGQHRTNLVFHTSRMVRFPGQARANADTLAAFDRDWDDSVLQSVWEDVIRYGLLWQQVGHLMMISSVGVLSIDGLIQMFATKNQDVAEARVDLMSDMLSTTRLLMLDASKNESYHREAVSFTDVPALLQELQMATAAAVGEPVTKLFGRSPAGMNATGDSDIRQWYDRVDTWREIVLKPRAERLMGACEGKPVDIEWPPLWEPTEKECAETQAIRVGMMNTLWTIGATTPDEIRTALHTHKPIEEVLVGPAPAPEPPPPQPAPPAADVNAEDEPQPPAAGA